MANSAVKRIAEVLQIAQETGLPYSDAEQVLNARTKAALINQAGTEGEKAAPTASSDKPIPQPRQRCQEREILSVIREKGYDPKALPVQKRGTKGVKSEVRASLKNYSPSVFDKAWDRLRSQMEIMDAE